jgi:serine/threonine protein kinase
VICPRCESPTREDQRFCGQCGAALELGPRDEPVSTGEVLDGKYRLSYLLGQGGMGAVYRAEVEGLGHTVAVKILHPHLSADAGCRRRLENEARLASQINHPNIVSILDYHSSPSLTYLVMEYLMGESLREVLQQVGYLGVQRAIHIGRQLLSALEASHGLNVLHRDLKPDNIHLIARQDRLDFVKVLDFGMAVHELAPTSDRITHAGQVCGTPAYMAPEQVRGQELTARSDLYAVGVILYECLTGVNPFLGANAADTLINHLTRTPDRPSLICRSAQIPPYLDGVVMQALRKNPQERFESARQFRNVIEALVLARQQASTESPAITTCPECGRPLVVGAIRCEACQHLLKKPGLGPEAIRDIVPREMMDALQQADSPTAEIRLQATIDSATFPSVEWDPPLVGRVSEVAALESFLSSSSPGARGHFLRIIGRAGSGKGRLTREAIHRARYEGSQICAVEADYPGPSPLYPIQVAVARLLELEAPPASETELLSAADQVGFDRRHQQGLLELFALGPAPSDLAALRRMRRVEAWREAVRTAARRRPTLLVFHDVESLDAPSRELVAALATMEPGPLPVKVIVAEDPDLFMLWPESLTLAVSPLSTKEALSLAALLLEQASVEGDPDHIAEASGGIPLMLVELVRLVAADPRTALPRTLADAITWRIGRIPARARTLLHALAVLGRPTSPDTLGALLGTDAAAESAVLNLLCHRGFLTVDEQGWRLAHRMYREVAYASIPVAVRSDLHLAASRLAVETGAPPSRIAYHLSEGGNQPGAVPYHLQAGLAAVAALDHTLASLYFSTVLRVVPGPPKLFEGSSASWLSGTLGLAAALAEGNDLASALHVLKAGAHAATEAGWHAEKGRIEQKRDTLRHRLVGEDRSASKAVKSLADLGDLVRMATDKVDQGK